MIDAFLRSLSPGTLLTATIAFAHHPRRFTTMTKKILFIFTSADKTLTGEEAVSLCSSH